MDVMVGCELCGSVNNLQRCSQCKTALYCSKEHQKAHWRDHRLRCEQLSSAHTLKLSNSNSLIQNFELNHSYTSTGIVQQDVGATSFTDFTDTRTDNYSRFSKTPDSNLTKTSDVGNGDLSLSSGLSSWSERLGSEKYLPASAFSNGIGHRVNTTSHLNLTSPKSSQENKQEFSVDYGDTTYQATGFAPSLMEIQKKLKHSEPEIIPYHHRNMRITPNQAPQFSESFVKTMCEYVIHDMDKYGICVIDDFLGKNLGREIFKEVTQMYLGGQFQAGQLMSNPTGNSSTIRGDKIKWVSGNEDFAYNIGRLIRFVDLVIVTSNRMKDNGKMGEYIISDRSKAMIACYPGNGNQYVKHVDNPNKDGRCITSIYYLNENWDVKKDGGLLRIFPSEWTSQVADIEPLFDRMLFFWSDRRNPHEVQPALRTRYAITLWYNDKSEKTAFRMQQLEISRKLGLPDPPTPTEM